MQLKNHRKRIDFSYNRSITEEANQAVITGKKEEGNEGLKTWSLKARLFAPLVLYHFFLTLVLVLLVLLKIKE